MKEVHGNGSSLDLDLRAERLQVLVLGGEPPGPDGQRPVGAQRWGHRGGVHVLRELALVCEGVHHRAVRGQLET